MVTTSSHGPRLTRSTAAQIPIAQSLTGWNLAALEHAPTLVVGDDPLVVLLLVPSVVQVVLVHRLAEGLLGELAALPELEGLLQARWKRFRLGGLVGVADELWPRVELVFDAVEPGGQQRGVAEVRIHVGAGDAALHPMPLSVPHDPEPSRPVVPRP